MSRTHDNQEQRQIDAAAAELLDSPKIPSGVSPTVVSSVEHAKSIITRPIHPATVADYEDKEGLYDRLISTFPPLVPIFAEENITDIGSLYQIISKKFDHTDYPAFYGQLHNLFEDSCGPYDERNGRLKIAAKLIAFTFNLAPEALFTIDAKTMKVLNDHADRAKRVERFAQLLFVASANNIVHEHKRLAAISSSEYLNRLSLWIRDKRLVASDEYKYLANAQKSPLENGNLIPAAARLIIFHKIKSSDLVQAIPELGDNLIFSDMVRDDLPNLAHAMIKKGIYTVDSFSTESSRLKISIPDASLIHEAVNLHTADEFLDNEKYNAVREALLKVFRGANLFAAAKRKSTTTVVQSALSGTEDCVLA